MNNIPSIGVGLRFPHFEEILEQKPDIDWLEVHSENFFGAGRARQYLLNIRKHYPISLHGVGLSLGSATELCLNHLTRLKQLIETVDPFLVSEHLSWSTQGNTYYPDLLPMPYTDESLTIIASHIQQAQDFLKRPLLIENPSSYITYKESSWEEAEFLNELLKRTGAFCLLDVNNVFVSAMNHGWNPIHYIQQINPVFVREIHLSGHSSRQIENVLLRIDSHDQPVCPDVWDLYKKTMGLIGEKIPTLLEWDDSIPPLPNLIAEAKKIKNYV